MAIQTSLSHFQYLLAIFVLPIFAQAGDSCSDLFEDHEPGKYRIVHSGTNPAHEKQLNEVAEVIFGKNGLAREFGLNIPEQSIYFMPTENLTNFASVGRPALPHWKDGHTLMTRRSPGVLEFVVNACPHCGQMFKSFYKDTTSFNQQIGILLHVAGHVDYGMTAIYETERNIDPIGAAVKLGNLMQQLYATEGASKPAVQEWYQYLITLTGLDDFANGAFDSPETLMARSKDRLALQNDVTIGMAHNEKGHGKFIAAYTSNVLQAIKAESYRRPWAPWRAQMLDLFEETSRGFVGIVQTKYLNEGWATFLMKFLGKYLPEPYQSHQYSLDHSDLMTRVKVEKLSNPYWLGTEAIDNLYKDYLENPSVAHLNARDKDRAFVRYFHENFMKLQGDFINLQRALTTEWVHEKQYRLVKKLSVPEIYALHFQGKIPQNKLEDFDIYQIKSLHRDRIVRHIARKNFYMPIRFPSFQTRIGVHNPDYAFQMTHDVVEDIPLQAFSMMKAMFVLARIMNGVVALDTIFSELWLSGTPPQRGRAAWHGGAPQIPSVRASKKNFPIRVVVKPNGQVEIIPFPETKVKSNAFYSEAEVNSYVVSGLQPQFAQIVEQYYEELKAQSKMTTAGSDTIPAHYRVALEKTMRQMALNVPHFNESVAGAHDPYSAFAIQEFLAQVNSVLFQRLRSAAQGKSNVTPTGNGTVKVKIMPDIPEFGLDYDAINRRNRELPDPPVDRGLEIPAMPKSEMMEQDDALTIISHRGGLGEIIFVKKKKPGQGEGQGDGDGDGEPEPGAGEPGDPSPGAGGGGGVVEVEVPEDLFASILAEEVNLPNLVKRSGKSPVTEEVRDGTKPSPYGQVDWKKTMPHGVAKAYKLWQDEQKKKKAKGLPYESKPKWPKLVQKGARMLKQDDMVVMDTAKTTVPDVNALVVFSMDASGSMGGDPMAIAKRFVYYIQTLLGVQYKNIVFRYVVWDTQAVEVPQKDFFKTDMGGSTDYAAGMRFAKDEIFADKQYPDSKWNKYLFTIGDSGHGGTALPDVNILMGELDKIVQFHGYLEVGDMSSQEFQQMLQEVSNSNQLKFKFKKLLSKEAQEILTKIKELFDEGEQNTPKP